jgi:hypothetical protein
MDIRLDLSKHCIETELKRQYNKAISAYFKAGSEQKPLMEPVIDLIQSALQTLDFAQLRTRYPALSGGTKCKVTLSRDGDNLTITVDDKGK